MTFLTPFPAILAAAVAIPALLLFYLLRLRRRPVRVSSTLLWRQATRDLQVNVPFRFLRPTLLFLLQLLILLLFLGAMARPALNMPPRAAAKVILLIDRSASMSAQDGLNRTTRLQEAKSRAAALLAQYVKSGAAISVIAFAAEARALALQSAPTAEALAALNGVQPTDQPGNLSAAMDLASTMIATDPDESVARVPPQVILFSDGAFANDRSLTLRGASFRFERIGPPASMEGSATSAQAGFDNLGIVAISARRDNDDPATIRLFVRVQSAARQDIAAPLSLTLNGREIDRRPLIVPGAVGTLPASESASEPSGSATATFQFATRDGGLAEVRIERPDLLAADDTAAITLSPATKPRLLLVIPDTAAPGPDAPSTARGPEWILNDLLSEMELPFRTISASTYDREVSTERGVRADLIIFDRVRPQLLPNIASLSFGAGLPLPGLDVQPDSSQAGTYFIAWERTHPLLRDVSLDSVFVSHATPVLGPSGPDAGYTVTELARGGAGALIVQADRRGIRHVLVGFPIADSTWPMQVSFPIFMSAAIDYLTLRTSARTGQMFTTGAIAEIDLPPGVSRIDLDGPVHLIAEAPTANTDPGAPQRVGLGLIERVGVYRAAPNSGSAAPSPVLAVNLLDPTESSLAVADTLRIGGDAVAGSGSGLGPRELWPWCIIAALVLLTVEWLLNAWLQRA